jgi:hypothetical protein
LQQQLWWYTYTAFIHDYTRYPSSYWDNSLHIKHAGRHMDDESLILIMLCHQQLVAQAIHTHSQLTYLLRYINRVLSSFSFEVSSHCNPPPYHLKHNWKVSKNISLWSLIRMEVLCLLCPSSGCTQIHNRFWEK